MNTAKEGDKVSVSGAGALAAATGEPAARQPISEDRRATGAPPGTDAPAKAGGEGLARLETHLREVSAESRELKSAAGGEVTGAMSLWLSAEYLAAGRERLAGADPEERPTVLREFSLVWSWLRRGEHGIARMALDRAKMELQRELNDARREKEFRKRLKKSKGPNALWPRGDRSGGLTKEARAQIVKVANLM